MFLQDTFSKSLEVSLKSLWSNRKRTYYTLSGYGLTRKWFLQTGVEFADLNEFSHKVSKKIVMQGKTGDRLLRETGSSSS